MKHLTSLLLVAFLAIASVASAQKIKLKKGDVLVDDTVWMKYEDCGTFDTTCSLRNLSGEEVIFMKRFSIDGVVAPTDANKDGSISYYEISFLGLNMKIELDRKTKKDMIEILYNGKVLNEDGTLNKEKVERIVEKYGAQISPRYKNYGN